MFTRYVCDWTVWRTVHAGRTPAAQQWRTAASPCSSLPLLSCICQSYFTSLIAFTLVMVHTPTAEMKEGFYTFFPPCGGTALQKTLRSGNLRTLPRWFDIAENKSDIFEAQVFANSNIQKLWDSSMFNPHHGWIGVRHIPAPDRLYNKKWGYHSTVHTKFQPVPAGFLTPTVLIGTDT